MNGSAIEPIVLTGAGVAAVTGGSVLAGSDRVLTSFSIDSRTVSRGDTFVAIKGDRFDGAAFAGAALDAGAAGAIVNRSAGVGAALAASHPDRAVIAVDDTIGALQALGRDVRRRSGATVVAVTGSAGKTTTKEVTAELLSARYRVYRNTGNLNNHIGLPFSLLQLVSKPEVAVVELGMNHPGEIRQLVAIAEPNVRVWTNVGDAHLGHFDSANQIADAKAEILEGATASSVLVANADDERVMQRARRFGGRVVTFGTSPGATIAATDIEDRGIRGTRARVQTPVGAASIDVSLVGRGNLLNVLAALAVALDLDVPLDAAVARLDHVRPARRRGEVVELAANVTLVDDSYNSSPTALMRALEAVGQDRTHDRRVAVLGEMLELGRFSESLHEECGRKAAESGMDALIAVGGAPAARLAAAATAAGMRGDAVTHVATSQDAAAMLPGFIRPGDLVLVKGSRGIRTDIVVDRLKAEWS